MRCTVSFSFVGGPHHFWHLAPVAAALSLDSSVSVRAFVNNADDERILNGMLAELGGAATAIALIKMELPAALRWIGVLMPKWRDLKVLRLLCWNRKLRQCDALVAAERTSTLLCRMPGRKPLMIHIPHGAGDRAQGFDKRIAMFDYVIVAGEKDKQRMVSLKLVDDNNCFVSGYIKLSALRRLRARQSSNLFTNDRPTICYNPHFDEALSSWSGFGRQIIESIAFDGRYNLIVAPHVRLFAGSSAEEKARWTALAISDRIIIDPGSDRSMDMTYTMAADIYLSDVSSQVYEFIAEPRPCIFINGHQAEWRNSPDYYMWHFGDVIDDISQLLPALDGSATRHQHYRKIQESAALRALGDTNDDAAAVAADLIKQVCR
jgi:hypothetical protein